MSQRSVKHNLYAKAFRNTVTTIPITSLKLDPEAIKKLIFYGVRVVNTKQNPPADEVLQGFQFADTVQFLIGLLTPAEFANLFPITKDFDGHKYGVKDYFYTRDYIKTLPDEPIGSTKQVMEFLWEYHNWEISEFAVNVLGYVSDLRELEGQPSIMKEFCDNNGIKTYTMHTDQKGKKFMVDNETGKSFRVKRKRPRYLKPVPGR